MTSFFNTPTSSQYDVPDGAKAMLVLIHGMAEHSARYRDAIGFFNAHGIACCSFDQRGHGRAPKTESERGDIVSFADVVTDAAAVIGGVRARHPSLPVFVWGHSMGAIVATLTAAHMAANGPTHIRGVITSSAPIAAFDGIPALLMRVAKIAVHLMPRKRLARPFRPERLSRDLQVGMRYGADPLVPKSITLRLLVQLAAASTQCLRVARKLRLPWLLLHGGDDEIAPPIGSQQLLDALASSDKQLRIWHNARHELHNEIEPTRTEFLTCITEWVLGRV